RKEMLVKGLSWLRQNRKVNATRIEETDSNPPPFGLCGRGVVLGLPDFVHTARAPAGTRRRLVRFSLP
ncbi:MAG: hypothetical protein AAGE98_10185, partial [Actinomycetota bacterium]